MVLFSVLGRFENSDVRGMQFTCTMIIRKAEISDLGNIMLMYKSCVAGMIANGIDQWDETYPNTEVIMKI